MDLTVDSGRYSTTVHTTLCVCLICNFKVCILIPHSLCVYTTSSHSPNFGRWVIKKKTNFSEFIFVLYEFLHCIKNNSNYPLVYPSRVTCHASLLSHRHTFIFHHPLPLGRVSLSPHYHLSLLVSHHTSLCCSCLHYVSRQRKFFSGKE